MAKCQLYLTQLISLLSRTQKDAITSTFIYDLVCGIAAATASRIAYSSIA
ncbi:hypothetical protein IMZ08_02605 [Bacillus luteolus]|uniref:Uncharacterized protein n=1 Tax=Litchfieldia luteola TaxID=682179 RepID=A0ABR9QEN2_9BACI|nr:hypothetical protein [Cytobacillus luteolus]MBE4906947.1 hypothetical protein [Cytobacillus luteolus]MBP1943588.1 hypothetical protein [Cytobacillus luteolus]